MKKVGITPYIEKFISPLCDMAKKHDINKIFLFGSSITDCFMFFKSDIDIYIDCGNKNIKSDIVKDIHSIVNNEYPIDILFWEDGFEYENIYEEINEGVCIYEKK